MQPVITTSLRRAFEIPCMIICSGTSRLVVIGGEHLPPPGEQRNRLLLDLMLGKPHGLGGEGSQANKVSVVTSDRAREAFKFHFYQTGQLMDKMECSNAAAAAGLFARLSWVARPRQAPGLFARLSRVARPRQAPGLLARLGQMARRGRADQREPMSSQINTTNTATGQGITLSIPEESEIWRHPWGVRFNLEPSVTQRIRECGEEQAMQARWTEFFTPVRLLLHGAAPVPPEHAFFLEPQESGS